ncbi:hypothetical protein GQ43DRAFT_138441 [Delitschia confertaspora ATCC 74209]|uniref:Glycosyl transferase CAP10 domain-containing protein n=1 Tax=Delitschia confertaspora ATCC 74209 TaxID=1513339 RepID=A0A9P4MTB6_9PLEO|nr:hypothetical protein GQ43DRAFT_138441 [Delitschia confertaspora ATCC 74209]
MFYRSIPQFLHWISIFIVLSQFWSFVFRPRPPPPPHGRWTFDPDHHANVHTLSQEQCDIAFPELYHSPKESVKLRGNRRIMPRELEIAPGRCMMRLLIYDRELFIIDDGSPEKCYVKNGNERERILGTLSQISLALATAPPSDPLPDIEFSITLDDLPRRSKLHGSFWAYTRKDGPAYDDVWLMPNYAYWSWNYTKAPSWQSIRRSIADTEQVTGWGAKHNKLVWRGKPKMADLRGDLLAMSAGKSWSDVKGVVINEHRDSSDLLTLEEFCGYRYTVQTEGTSYSGRLKYLQLCRSMLISHPLEWQEFHTHLMTAEGEKPNFVETSPDWANLDAIMEFYTTNPDVGEWIAGNAWELFHKRYLTSAAVTCYWRRLITSWASVQGFTPMLYVDERGNKWEGRGKRKMRGEPFAAFAANWPAKPERLP